MNTQEHEQTFDVGEECAIVVETASGDLKVSGWDKNQVTVRSPGGEPTIERDGPRLKIRSHPSDDLTLRVPHFSDVKARLASGDARFTDIFGKASITTTSGDIKAENQRGDLQVRSVSGDVSLRACDLTSLDAGTVSGECVVESGLDQEGTYRMSSVSGDLRLLIPEDQPCTVHMHSLSGRLRCRLRHITPRRRRRQMEALINGGGVEFRARTVSGNVVVGAAEHVAEPEERPKARPAEPAQGPTQAAQQPEREPFGVEEEGEAAAPASVSARRMEILRSVEEGELSVSEALAKLRQLD